MPVRNGGSYLAIAVRSILQQNEADLELLLINDHSDDSAITDLDCNDSRIRLLQSPGNGIVAALNHGIQAARGQYIARMDADDIAYPQRLQTQIQWLENQPHTDIVATRVNIIAEPAVAGGYLGYQKWINALTTASDIAHALFIESPIPHPSVLMPRWLLLELGAYRQCSWAEDYDLWLRANQRGYRFGKPGPILLDWRDYPERSSRVQARYSRAEFSRAKACYLSAMLPGRPVIIWGAGPTGKRLCKALGQQQVRVEGFIDINPQWLGNRKQGLPVFGREKVMDCNAIILVAVSRRGARQEIENFLFQHGKKNMTDYILCA